MKIKVLSAFIFATMLFASCTNENGKSKEDSLMGNTTMHDITRPIGQSALEDLLDIKDEAELKTKFGNDRISYDTIWGPEGSFFMGSYIDKGFVDEVQIFWKDSARRVGVSSAMIKAHYDTSGNYTFSHLWCSAKGVKIGTTSDELEKINGRAFVFSGFGWDYGGGVRDWKGGKLDASGLSIELTEGEITNKISEKEYTEILGDQDVTSDHPIVKKVQPRVYRMSVYRPE